MLSKLLMLLKAKAAITAVTAVLVVGGATAAFAATPPGQGVMHNLMNGHATATVTATSQANHGKQGDSQSQNHGNTCPGQTDAQNLATTFGLSTDANGAAVQAICALHTGTFKGTTTDGASVTATRVYGYGEIDQLLTLAQSLDTKAGTKLSDANVSSSLADALHTCASAASVAECVNDQHGNGNKPTTTPTPNGNKPTSTPTPPNGNKPTSTPTPHN